MSVSLEAGGGEPPVVELDDETPMVALDELDGEILAALRADPLVRELAVDHLGWILSGEVIELSSWSYLLGVLTDYRVGGGVVQCPLDAVGRVVRELVAAAAAELDEPAAALVRTALSW